MNTIAARKHAIESRDANGLMDSTARADLSPLELLVIQPSPFCNLNCDYCYIPSAERANSERMSFEVLDRIFREVFASPLARQPFTIAWHAGEPTALPMSFYEEAFAIVAKNNVFNVPVVHSFQSNGTIINEAWCEFIKKHRIQIGLSIDGPAFLHDLNRKRRSGAPTHKRVVETVRLLRRHGIPFSVISVLTSKALEHPDEMFDFLVAEGIYQIGFNIEEVEGPNQSSSMQLPDAQRKYARFLKRIYHLSRTPNGPPKVMIREMDRLDQVFHGIKRGEVTLANFAPTRSQEANPFAILSFDYKGNFSTFSPELVGMKSEHYGDFSLGNIMDTSIEQAIDSVKFRQMWNDVRAGIDKCRASCSHFNFCGGGSASNKYYENGTFDSDETMACRLSKKLRIDVVKHVVGLETEEKIAELLAEQPTTQTGDVALPEHLIEEWWTNASQLGSEQAHGLKLFVDKVEQFARFRGLDRGERVATKFVVRESASETSSEEGVEGAGSAILNLGDSAVAVVLRTVGAEFSRTIAPRSSYWLGSGEKLRLSAHPLTSELEVICFRQAATV